MQLKKIHNYSHANKAYAVVVASNSFFFFFFSWVRPKMEVMVPGVTSGDRGNWG